MKKSILITLALLLTACSQIIPTPNGFPPSPSTVIVEFPYNTVVPTYVPWSTPIQVDDLDDAKNFLLIIKTQAIAGDDEAIANSVYYPINVNIDGEARAILSAEKFLDNSRKILNDRIIKALVDNSEEDLTVGLVGIRVGNGELWFNLFCMDPACTQKDFLITQINN
jgi:hypothetical protein